MMQFGIVKALSTKHLVDLIKDGQNDFFIPVVAGAKQHLVISITFDGVMSVFEPASEHHDRFAPELLLTTYADRLVRTGRLFYRTLPAYVGRVIFWLSIPIQPKNGCSVL